KIPRYIFNSTSYGSLNIFFQHGGDIHICQSQAHVLTSDPDHRDGTNALVAEKIKIHVPEPGNIDAVLGVVIDGDDHIFWRFILHSRRNILIESRGVFGKIESDPRSLYPELLHPAVFRIEFPQHIIKMLPGKS